MAGRKLIRRPSLPASTILEVVISMVIIMVIFGIAMMIIANVAQSSLSIKKIKANAVLNETIVDAEESNNLSSQSFMIDDIRIEQTVKLYNAEKNLGEIDLSAYDINQVKIAELQKVVILK